MNSAPAKHSLSLKVPKRSTQAQLHPGMRLQGAVQQRWHLVVPSHRNTDLSLPKHNPPYTPTCGVLLQRQEPQIKSLPASTPAVSHWPVLRSVFLMPVSQFWQAHMENSTSDYTQCSMHNCSMNRWRKESQPSFNIFWLKLLQRNYCKQEFQRSESTGPVKKN